MQSKKTGISQISGALNLLIKTDSATTILLETMTGKGSEIGGTFEELKEIIDQIDLKEKVGVCIDTCHVYDAGYDIVNDFENVLNIFDKIIGINRLKAIHVNNSKNELGSKKDRHEKINSGKIPLEFFEKLINHKMLKNLVFILETPQINLEGYAEEIVWLKSKFTNL
jgi:deoxyribonuclease-4